MSSRESLEAAQHGWEQAVGTQLRRAEVAEAEARALRAALERIAGERCMSPVSCAGMPVPHPCPSCVANEALKEPGHE